MTGDWRSQLLEHPVVQGMGYDARDMATNPNLCPVFIPAPDMPLDDDERDEDDCNA